MTSTAPAAPLRRDTRHGLVAGVLAGLGQRLGVDPVLLRVVFVAAAIASGGLALLAYVIAWVAIPAEDGGTLPLAQLGSRLHVRGEWMFVAAVALLTLTALLIFRQLGIWWSDAVVWPLALAAFGAVLLWGRVRGSAAAEEGADGASPEPWRGRGGFTDLYRGVFGVLLVLGAALLFLSSNHVLGGLREAAFTAVVAVVAIALILAPFLWRLGRNLAAERAERIRSQERAELAAHLHDSVLQTLTLMQKRAGDPQEVAMLARRQERELRDWLASDRGKVDSAGLAAALRTAAEEVEDDHGVAIELIVVGDCPVDEKIEALVAAGQEALVNAARHAPDSGPIRAYAEITPERIELFVHDRGPGFDPAAVPDDRRGVRESILGRMERAGGRATIRSDPATATGTEVELELDREPAEPERSR